MLTILAATAFIPSFFYFLCIVGAVLIHFFNGWKFVVTGKDLVEITLTIAIMMATGIYLFGI
jgi:hypothetical protein